MLSLQRCSSNNVMMTEFEEGQKSGGGGKKEDKDNARERKNEDRLDVRRMMDGVDVGEIVNRWIEKARDVHNLSLMVVSWQP